MNKTKIVIVMALLSILTLSAFSAINTNIAQAADEPSFRGQGQIATAHWEVQTNSELIIINAFFAEQLYIDANDHLANGVYIEVIHPLLNNGMPSAASKELSSLELSQSDSNIQINVIAMAFPWGTGSRSHNVAIDWDIGTNVAHIIITSATGGIHCDDVSDWAIVDETNPVASAYVTKLNGNKNDLTITVKDVYFDFMTNKMIDLSDKFSINNNAAGTYAVGSYNVYVDTKGNDQIRACYIVVK